MSTSTIKLHRVLRATPEKVYRAFLDVDAMAKWLPPNACGTELNVVQEGVPDFISAEACLSSLHVCSAISRSGIPSRRKFF